jgi:hypothetical protein
MARSSCVRHCGTRGNGNANALLLATKITLYTLLVLPVAYLPPVPVGLSRFTFLFLFFQLSVPYHSRKNRGYVGTVAWYRFVSFQADDDGKLTDS